MGLGLTSKWVGIHLGACLLFTHNCSLFRGTQTTWCHEKGFIESVVHLLRLFLMLGMMPLDRCVATENDLIALLRNKARNKKNMSLAAGLCSLTLPLCSLTLPFHLLPQDGSAHILYSVFCIKNYVL